MTDTALTTIASLLPVLADKTGVLEQHIASVISDVTGQPPQGTMRHWMQAHDGQRIDTVQVNLHDGSVWAPVRRKVDAYQHATYVHLNSSAREYRGMRVQHTTTDSIIVQDDWHEILYTVSIY